ncbi:MAG: ABC transporter ATP-binding protein, partial [Chloroflexi bacterium]|nr:ABC transporter ATP-binding protein [Chloroflexota bacterium]
MVELRALFRYVRPYWKQMTLAGLALVAGSLISLALPWALRALVDSVFVSREQEQLNRLILSLLALFLLQSVLTFAQSYLLTFVAPRVTVDLRRAIYDRMVGLPLRFLSERRVGELVSRVTNDITVIQVMLTETPISLLREVITLGGGIVLMVLMNWQLTALVFVLVPLIIGISAFFGRRLQRLSTAVQDRLADATAVLEETLAGVRVVKSFVQEESERRRFGSYVEAGFGSAMKRTRLRAVFMALLSFLGLGLILLLLWFGGRQVLAGKMTPGEMVAFLVYLMLVSGPMAAMAGLYSQVQEAIGAARRVLELMQAEPEPLDDPQAPKLPPVEGWVRFVDVHFSYNGVEPVLQGINLEVKPGEVIALVGHSGVGKTTLVNLLLRFYDPTAGHIEIDGYDIRRVRLRSLREQIGLVPQDIFLFGGTVRENIAYGKPGASDEEIAAAARAAYAEEFIANLPAGYDTVIGERGVRLSSGQRQRLAIAQALLKDPRILILDEPTSALDAETEHEVQVALERLMRGRTTFIIAHRLATVQRADR